MRVIKEADVRKNEILDAAEALFVRKGFDGTSTNEILDAVGIARGTLYHHFKSKEDIMDALIERHTGRILEKAKKAAEDKSVSVEERMVRTVRALHVEEEDGKEMIEHLHKPQNALMNQKTKRIVMRSVPPIMEGILKDGIEQGIFETPYPLECMEMMLCYLDTVLDEDVFELTQEQQIDKIEAFIFNLERMLGVEKGSLAFVRRMFGEE